ncbi:MAG: hypothetical protein ABI760_01620 [Ferruginibacter sp.]
MTEEATTIENIAGNPGDENKFINPSILDFIQRIIKKWWLFLIIGFLAGVYGVFDAGSKKPVFESRLTFAIDAGSNDGPASAALNLAAQFGLGLGSGQTMFDGDNILEIMKSRRIVENVLLSVDTFQGKPFTLAEYYIEMSEFRKVLDNNSRTKNLHYPVGSSKTALNYLQDSILNNLYLGFNMEYIIAERPDKKLSIYELRIKSFDEKFSKIFTDRIIEEAGIFYTEITSKKDRETLEILEQRVASLKSNVGASIHSKASGQDANVNPAFIASQSPILMQQYNMQAYGEAYKEMFKTLEMARYQYLKKIPLLQIIDPADYPMKRVKQGRLKTAIIYSAVSCFVLLFILWVTGLFKKKYTILI